MWNPIIYPSGSPYKYLDQRVKKEDETHYVVPEHRENFYSYSDRLDCLTVVINAIESVLGEELHAYEQDTEEKRIKEDLGADSLDMFNLSLELEKEFKINISPYMIENMKIGEIVDYLLSIKENSWKKIF